MMIQMIHVRFLWREFSWQYFVILWQYFVILWQYFDSTLTVLCPMYFNVFQCIYWILLTILSIFSCSFYRSRNRCRTGRFLPDRLFGDRSKWWIPPNGLTTHRLRTQRDLCSSQWCLVALVGGLEHLDYFSILYIYIYIGNNDPDNILVVSTRCFAFSPLRYGYGSIPINTIFSGMNIHKSQLFWCELQGYKVLTHCHIGNNVPNNIFFSIQLGMSSSQLTNSIIFQRGRSTTNQAPMWPTMWRTSTLQRSLATLDSDALIEVMGFLHGFS